MKRTYLRIGLQMDSNWRVGSWESQAADVVGTLTDAANRPLVPGSGVAGALRQASGADRTSLFGSEPASRTVDASFWWVLGTTVDDAEISERQRTRIDRVRRSAAEKGLFRAEEVTPNSDQSTSVTVYLRSEHYSQDPQKEVVTPLTNVLKKWQPRIGGGRSIGMGRATITEVTHRTLDLDVEQDLLDLLSAPGSPVERVNHLLEEGQSDTGLQATDAPYLSLDPPIG